MALEADDPYSVMVKSKSPLAYWRLAELTTDTTSVLDYIASKNGTAVNTPTRETASLTAWNTDRCYTFNGTTHRIDFTDDATLEFTSGSFSVGAWINPNSIPSNVVWRTILHKHVGSLGWGYSLNNSLQYYSVGNGTTDTEVWSNTAFVAGVTRLVGFTYDGPASTLTFYRDGVADGVHLTLSQPLASTAVFTIGSDAGGGSNFDGRIDEPFVTATALTAADWADIFTVGRRMFTTPTFNAIPLMR